MSFEFKKSSTFSKDFKSSITDLLAMALPKTKHHLLLVTYVYFLDHIFAPTPTKDGGSHYQSFAVREAFKPLNASLYQELAWQCLFIYLLSVTLTISNEL